MATMPNRTLNPDFLLTPVTACARASYAAICKDAMAYLLMAHLQCFYCGCRSAQKQDGHIRTWQCEKCQAVNHLDEVCLLSCPRKGPRLIANVPTCRKARSQTLRLWSPLRKSDTPKIPVAPSLLSSDLRTRRSFVPPASKTNLSSPRTWLIISLHLPTRDTRHLRHPTLRTKSLSNNDTLQCARIANPGFWSSCGRQAMLRKRTTWGG